MGDFISRQAAIDTIHKAVLEMFNFCDDIIEEPLTYTEEKMLEVNKLITGKIRDLPSAQPEIAKRIVVKSRGGVTFWYQCIMCNEPVDAQDNFCSGCGRRLTDG